METLIKFGWLNSQKDDAAAYDAFLTLCQVSAATARDCDCDCAA